MSEQNPGEWRNPETGKVNGKEIWYRMRSAFAVLLSLAVLVGGGWFVFSKAQAAWMDFRTADDYVGNGVAPVVVTIPSGATVTEIGTILVQADVVKKAATFVKVAKANENAQSIQAGKYNLLTQLPAATALEMLLDKNNIAHNRMTLKDGKWISQQVSTMSKATGIKAADFTAAYKAGEKDSKYLGLPKWSKNGLEGFLFPDTYEIPDKPTAQSVIKVATAQFATVAQDLDLEAKANAMGLSPYQIVVLASIIEKEAGTNDEDRAKIARVFYNRLDPKMWPGGKLQSDATVAYANKITGHVLTTPAQRALASPWNTYYVKGLPKGPITSPSKKSLEAALNPVDGKWLYFMVVNLDTGETVFSNDAAGQAAASARFQAWCTASQANRDKCNGK